MFASVSRCVASFGRGGVPAPEKDFGSFLGRFSGASPALRRTKTEAG